MSKASAASQMLMRLYAIQYALSALPFGTSLLYLSDDIHYEIMYDMFIKDLENKFGQEYINIFYEPLFEKYIIEEKLDDPKRGVGSIEESQPIYKEAKDLFGNQKYQKEIFVKYFKNDHFKKTVSNILSLLVKENKQLLNEIGGLPDDFYMKQNLLDYELSKITIFNNMEIASASKDLFFGVLRPDKRSPSGKVFSLYIRRDLPIKFDRKKKYSNNHIHLFTTDQKDYKTAYEEFFKEFFTREIPLEQIHSGFIMSVITLMNSIQKYNNMFDASKSALKTVFEVMERTADYTKKQVDTGMSLRASKLKVALAIPNFIIKATAESIDPNVKIASMLTNAYAAGIVAAEASGMKLDENVPKQLPLFVTSPIVTLATSFFIPPITPMGYAAIALSLKDLDLSSDNSIHVPNKDKDKNNC
jgi:hypothetical protein